MITHGGATTRQIRLQVMLTSDELKAVEGWRFAHRMPSRSSAVRELLRRGLVAEGFAPSIEDSKNRAD
ncbi:MAG TPA: hypothetical protein VH933_05600 [Aestuariivirgaceae bacterium]